MLFRKGLLQFEEWVLLLYFGNNFRITPVQIFENQFQSIKINPKSTIFQFSKIPYRKNDFLSLELLPGTGEITFSRNVSKKLIFYQATCTTQNLIHYEINTESVHPKAIKPRKIYQKSKRINFINENFKTEEIRRY